MTAILLQPGNVRVVSMRVLHFWRGTWLAELELDHDPSALAPSSGKVTIAIGAPPTATLAGTIDPRGSGVFGDFTRLRVLGGGAGWDQLVRPQDFAAGVTNQEVIAATATEVGEVATVLPGALVTYQQHYWRAGGRASQVLDACDWWVDPATGTTNVGPRTPAAPDASLELMSWDPATEVAELHCETLVLPGTALVDPRIPAGPVTVRDVEQTFDATGSKVVAWCGTAATAQLVGDLRALVEAFSGKRWLTGYLYRIVLQESGQLQLQSVEADADVPDTLPLPPWTGVSGASSKYKPGSLVRVTFFRGDPSKPAVDLYDGSSLPLESTLDATVAVHVGPSAPLVALAGGASPLVLATPYESLLTALGTFASSMAAAATGPLAPMAAPATALGSALTALPPPATVKTVAA